LKVAIYAENTKTHTGAKVPSKRGAQSESERNRSSLAVTLTAVLIVAAFQTVTNATPIWFTLLIAILPIVNSWALKWYELRKLKPSEPRPTETKPKPVGKFERVYPYLSALLCCSSALLCAYWAFKIAHQPASPFQTIGIVVYLILVWENIRTVALLIHTISLKRKTDPLTAFIHQNVGNLVQSVALLSERVEKLEKNQIRKTKIKV
jgi:hypothetical protein